MKDWTRKDGEPCADKACGSLDVEGCLYPNWMMCGHPTIRVQRFVVIPDDKGGNDT